MYSLLDIRGLMHLLPPSLPPFCHDNRREGLSGGILSGGIYGQLTLHPSVAIAPTALLQVEPGSHLILGAGVCIGSGALLHAHGGTLEIESGASLGAAVLLVGSGKIGANACVGSMVTIINPAIAPGDVIPAGVLLGDSSRSPELSFNSTPLIKAPTILSVNGAALIGAVGNPTVEPLTSASSHSSPPDATIPDSPPHTLTQNGTVPHGKVDALTLDLQQGRNAQTVPGTAALNELLTALFPHRQEFEQP